MRSKERRQEGVYEILDWLEKERGQCVKVFWSCVFQDHILQKYPVLRLLRNSLVDDSPLKRGEKPDIWMWDFYKTSLPVTCGDKKGSLHRGKLAEGVKCILHEGNWFSPGGFEKLAGKGNCKNWKLSLRCQKTPLQKLIKEGHLQCPRMKRHCVRKSRRALLPASSSESSSPQSSVEMEGSSEDQEEESEEDGEQEEEDNEEEDEEEEDEEEEEESEPVDLSQFEAAVLPVSCGSVTGDLYKNRFVGSRSKSIRTDERWFTPEEFIRQELTLTDGHWKKDIRCHGKTLYYLVKKKILYFHSLLCDCDRCCPDDKLAQNNDDVCFICDSDGKLECCDGCPRAFHQDCHLPPPPKENTGENWMCTFCVWKFNQQIWIHKSLEDALNSPVDQNVMRCEYLLLCLYKEDTQRVFTDDPYTTVPRYSSVISNPMWLNRVKTKLERNKYSTVGQFVDDIRLIFQNCQTFNRDNDFGMMGARLSEIFEQKFRIVFKIQ
ncbi:hypothetical protein PDJAM_G00177020 [Pangasius djambal]|uniref:Uncharacterized protein n=1 Tax=Pangasius djambal TaxID=1691987 RepID=A0ACC5ZNC5_9TELE|nr:hypothetical protein [Pangasius djambal]